MTEPKNYAFLHGGGQGSWVWQETIAALDSQTNGNYGQALTLDIPGCGTKRQRTTENINFEEIIAEMIADLESSGMANIIMVGHSQAGCVLPKLAELKPELIARLVYVSCSTPSPGQTVLDMIGDGVHGADENKVGWPVDPQTSSMRERSEIMLCNDMDDSETAAFMARLGGDQWPASSYIETDWQLNHLGEIPATYVTCLQDNILPVNWQNQFAQRFKAEKTVKIDAGHQVMNTRPHALAEVLRRETVK